MAESCGSGPVLKTVDIDVMPEITTENKTIPSNRKVTVHLQGHGQNDTTSSICINHGGKKDALIFNLNRTIRVPDNRDINNLPPGLGDFPLFKVADYAHKMPEDMAKKGGIFFPMYQREAMWINFSASAPFAIKIYVGGVNAVSGFPMTENEKTKEKRSKMLESNASIQDYMVVPGQRWLDGIASEDGNIRQFVAQPKGSGYSVEAQVTGEEKVGGIQIEIIPVKKILPVEFDVRFENKDRKVITRKFNLAEKGLTADSTWRDFKERIKDEFGAPVALQRLRNYKRGGHFGNYYSSYNMDFSNDTKLGDVYFPPEFSTISVSAFGGGLRSCGTRGGPGLLGATHMSFDTRLEAESGYEATSPIDSDSPLGLGAASLPPQVKEMGLAAGGFIQQAIEADHAPADSWDIEASVMLNLQILDVESFCAVTGKPAPETPVDAKAYALHGYPFFEIWNEDKTGIKGEFSEVKSVAQIDAEKAKAEGREYKDEESVPMRVVSVGRPIRFFKSTFRPIEFLRKEAKGLNLE